MTALPYVGNISDITLENKSFRKVLYTGDQLQLVAMCLKPGEDTGRDMHEKQDVIIRIESGDAMIDIDGFEYTVTHNMAIVVPVGSKHIITNTSKQNMLYLHIVYTLPYHPDYKIHATREEAERDKPKPVAKILPPKKIVAPIKK